MLLCPLPLYISVFLLLLRNVCYLIYFFYSSDESDSFLVYSNALLATLNARDHLRNRSSFVNHTSQIRFGTDTRPRLSQTDSALTMSVARSQSHSSAPSVAFSTLEQCYWTIEEENTKDECSIRQSSRLHYV